MRLNDADIALLVEKFEEMLREYRDGPMQVQVPYTPRDGQLVVISFDYREMEILH